MTNDAARAFVRGEARWSALLSYGVKLQFGPGKVVGSTPAHPEVVRVETEDLIYGLRALVDDPERLQQWAQTMLTLGIFDFAPLGETVAGNEALEIVWDAAFGQSVSTLDIERLARMVDPR